MEKIETHKYAYDYAYSVEAWVKQEIYKDFFLIVKNAYDFNFSFFFFFYKKKFG